MAQRQEFFSNFKLKEENSFSLSSFSAVKENEWNWSDEPAGSIFRHPFPLFTSSSALPDALDSAYSHYQLRTLANSIAPIPLSAPTCPASLTHVQPEYHDPTFRDFLGSVAIWPPTPLSGVAQESHQTEQLVLEESTKFCVWQMACPTSTESKNTGYLEDGGAKPKWSAAPPHTQPHPPMMHPAAWSEEVQCEWVA